MTVGSVKHPNVLPQAAAASSARVTAAYDYNGAGSSGVGSGLGGGGSGGGGSIRSGGGGAGGGRNSPHSVTSSSSSFGMMRSSTKRCLFDSRPDPIESKRICDEHDKAERQRTLNRYGFDPLTGRGLSTSSSSTSSSSAMGLHHRHHHQ